MLKNIKNIVRILIITAAAIIVLALFLMLVMSLAPVQTYISKIAADYISKQTGATVSIDKLNFSFFNHISLTNLLIKDQNHDTMLYVPRITAGIINTGFKTGLNLGNVYAKGLQMTMITDSSGVMNLTWYLDMLQNKEQQSQASETVLRINRIKITDGRYSLIKKVREKSKTPVDFNNLNIYGLNAEIENLNVNRESFSMDINGLSFRESSGLDVNNMAAHFAVYDKNILFENAIIETDSSFLELPLVALMPANDSSFRDFINSVKLDIQVKKSGISGKELHYFVPLKSLPENIMGFEGNITGTISELRGRNIKVTLPGNTSLNAGFSLSGLPDIKNTFIFFEINRLETTPEDIQRVKLPNKSRLTLPVHLQDLGKMVFTGTFSGFTTDFVTYGRLNTMAGALSTDLSLRPETEGRFRIKGSVKGTDLDIGMISGKSELLGRSTIYADIDGETGSFKTFAVNLTGKIDSIEINDYQYRNIGLKGYFTDKTWDGAISAEDDNISMNLLGMFDFTHKLPEFDFTLNLKKANLYRLNIDRKDSTSSASLLLAANFRGNNIDNLDGEIKLLNSSFRKYGNKLDVYDFSLKTYSGNGINTLTLNTDFFNLAIRGHYNFASLGDEFRRLFSMLFPSRFGSPEPIAVNDRNNFDINIDFKKIDALNKFLNTGLSIAENSEIKGTVSPDSTVIIEGLANTLSYKNNIFSGFSFLLTYNDSLFNAGAKSSSFNISDIAELRNFAVNFSSFPDHFRTSVKWDDQNKVINKGILEATGEYLSTQAKKGNGKNYLLRLNIMPGEIYVRNNLWKINPAEIAIDSNSFKISRFTVSNNDNYFSIEGAASHDVNDTVFVGLKGININGLNYLYEKNAAGGEGALHLAARGILDGKISLTDIYRNFMFESDIRIKDFSLLESNYGEVKIWSVWNSENRIADIQINNNLGGRRMFDISGYYDPVRIFIDLHAKADKLPLEIMNPLLKFFASGITGTATGEVNFSGKLSKPYLTGSLFAENGSIKIDYLQSRFSFNDSIRFDREAIRFRNILMKDERGNPGTLDGAVFHKNFKDYSVDLTVRTSNCMVLNTRAKDNELFYGTAFASGVTTIKTLGPVLRFDISARTGRNTRFFIPLNSGMSVAESSYITFVNKEADNTKETAIAQQSKQPAAAKTEMEIAFDLEVTPDAEVQLIMDPKTGDIMKGSGSGNLNISLDRKGTFRIFGDYTIENGDYLFTLGNIINKSFSVMNGGKITFNGDLEKADIDIKAVYKTKTSLYDIMPGLLPDTKLNERIPVECLLILTGKLFNPVVGFDINLPTADEETRAYLRSVIKSEEEMSRQFLFLLVMNSFYADPTAGTQLTTSDISSATVGVTTMEMLSNQLSNWLSQISKDFDIGVVYRPGSTAMPNSQELQVALSTQLLNDKVTINGNFDVGGNQASGSIGTTGTNTITGAFNIEYSISDKLKFRFFNRSNDNLYINNGIQYTQGIGLFFRQDFNRFGDLFTKKEKNPAKKEEEIKAVNK